MSKIKKPEQLNRGEVIIYKPKVGGIEIKVKFQDETVWLDAHQTAKIFDVDRTVIVKHIRNIYKSGELTEKSTCAFFTQVAADGKVRKMNFYNLDMVISVGYRVNSQRATQFRVWATKVLKGYLLKGYAVNENRLLEAKDKFNELQNTIAFLRKKTEAKMLEGQEKEILNLLADYSKTLTLLGQYDKSQLKEMRGKKSKFFLIYEDCKNIINEVKEELISKKEAGDIFGNEIEHKFESIAKNLYQTFAGKELYGSIEEKAAHLLYLIVKDHPLSDGNKRIGSFMFVYFLDKNNYLHRENGEKKINDNALTALALLIAGSKPEEKNQMIALITQLLR